MVYVEYSAMCLSPLSAGCLQMLLTSLLVSSCSHCSSCSIWATGGSCAIRAGLGFLMPLSRPVIKHPTMHIQPPSILPVLAAFGCRTGKDSVKQVC